MNNISSVKESGLVEQVNPKDFEFNLVLKWKDIPDEGHCATWIEYWDNNGKRKHWRTDEKDMARMDNQIEDIYTHFKDKTRGKQQIDPGFAAMTFNLDESIGILL